MRYINALHYIIIIKQKKINKTTKPLNYNSLQVPQVIGMLDETTTIKYCCNVTVIVRKVTLC